MSIFAELRFPLQDPVQVFTVILLIILLVPLFLNKLRIPGVVGLILAGAFIGPHGFNLLQASDTSLFGTVGLLYIMFVAGLEIDLNDFKKSRNKSIVFGLITFSVPLISGTLASYYLLNYSLQSSILLASMFATHTLIAYPIASRLGITRNEAVTIAVGGTIITDTLALLILAIISGSANGVLNHFFWIKLSVSLLIFVVVVLWGFPKASKWFFRNAEKEGVSQYIFSIALVFIAAFFAELAGLEAIIGAFLAGLALNRQIPHTSALMNRIEFVGNALFIPFFLINVGMLVNPEVILDGPQALIVAATLIVVAIGSKWLAAFFTQKIFNFSVIQRNVIFGLSSAHAAATIAIIIIGFKLNILNSEVLNATILLILVTCVVSSFVVDRAGRKLALQEKDEVPDTEDQVDNILVPVANPETLEHLIDLAFIIKSKKGEGSIYPLSIIYDDQEAQGKVKLFKKNFEKAIKHAASFNQVLKPISRVDINASSGIIRTMKEMMISTVIMGWNGHISAGQRIFGSVLDNVLESTNQMVLVTKLLHPLNTFNKIIVVMPPYAGKEAGFYNWLEAIKNISSQTTGKIHCYGDQRTLMKAEAAAKEIKPFVEVESNELKGWEGFLALEKEVTENDLLVLINARNNTISYHDYLSRIPRYLSRNFIDRSFMIIYPHLVEDDE